MEFIKTFLNCFIEDELIGIWTRYDDGSGFLYFFGWSLRFDKHGAGKKYNWDKLDDENGYNAEFDIEWLRIADKVIKIRIKGENDWTELKYDISIQTCAYDVKCLKLVECDKEIFWTFHEPL